MNVRRSAASAALGLVLVAGGASAAFAADGTYPPSTPTPTVSGLSISSQPPAVAGVSQSRATLAYTGTDVLSWSLLGGGLVLAGTALAFATRRRGARA